jgi:hypothetical protein
MRSFWKCWNCFCSKEEKVFKELKWMKFINQHEIVCSSFFASFCFLSLSFNSLISFSFCAYWSFFLHISQFHIGQFLFIFSTFCFIFDLFQDALLHLGIFILFYLCSFCCSLFSFQLPYLSISQLLHVLMSSLNS